MTSHDPITAIADQLAAQAEQITRLEGRLAELSDQAAALGRVVGEHAAALTQLAAPSQADPDPDAYCPGPAPAWWKLAIAERAEPIARLRAWYSAWAETRAGLRAGCRYSTDHSSAAMSSPYRHRSWAGQHGPRPAARCP